MAGNQNFNDDSMGYLFRFMRRDPETGLITAPIYSDAGHSFNLGEKIVDTEEKDVNDWDDDDDAPSIHTLSGGTLPLYKGTKRIGFSGFGFADPMFSLEYIGDGDFGYDAGYNSDLAHVARQIKKLPKIIQDRYSSYLNELKNASPDKQKEMIRSEGYMSGKGIQRAALRKALKDSANEYEQGAYQVAPGYKFFKYPYTTLLDHMSRIGGPEGDESDALLYLVEAPFKDVIKASEIGSKYIGQRNNPSEIVSKSIRPIMEVPMKDIESLFEDILPGMPQSKNKEQYEKEYEKRFNDLFGKDKMGMVWSDRDAKCVLDDLSNWYKTASRQSNITKGIRGDRL